MVHINLMESNSRHDRGVESGISLCSEKCRDSGPVTAYQAALPNEIVSLYETTGTQADRC